MWAVMSKLRIDRVCSDRVCVILAGQVKEKCRWQSAIMFCQISLHVYDVDKRDRIQITRISLTATDFTISGLII